MKLFPHNTRATPSMQSHLLRDGRFNSWEWCSLRASVGVWLFLNKWQFSQAENRQCQSLGSVRASFGTRLLIILECEESLVKVHVVLRQYPDVKNRLRRILENQGQAPNEPNQTLLGQIHGDHEDTPIESYKPTLRVMTLLSLYVRLERYNEAGVIDLSSEDRIELEQFGKHHSATLYAVVDLAGLFDAQSKHEGAKVMCRNVIDNSTQWIADENVKRAFCNFCSNTQRLLQSRTEISKQLPNVDRELSLEPTQVQRLHNAVQEPICCCAYTVRQTRRAKVLFRQVKEHHGELCRIKHKRTLATSENSALVLS